MASIQDSLNALMTADGAVCAALVDSTSGMLMGSVGSGVDMELAAAGNTEVVRAKLKTMRMLNLNDQIAIAAAHEVGHVVNRHSMQQLTRGLGLATLASLMTGGAAGGAMVNYGAQIWQLA